MNSSLVSVIIVNWNGEKWLDDCLRTLFAQDYKNLEVIIVDNKSNDDSVEFIRNNYKEVVVIENEKNLGFGAANNIGVKKSKGEIIFFLNNDTKCFPDTISKLLDCKTSRNLDILSPNILNQNGECLPIGQYSSGMDFLGTPIGPNSKLFYIEGCSMMISRDDFNDLGGFDNKYFMYSEDIDLCWRAYLYGMKLGICEKSKLIHFGGGSSNKTRYEGESVHVVPFFRRSEVEKNNLRNLLKNYNILNLLWIIPLFLLQELLEMFLYLITGNYKMIQVILKSIYWNIANITDTIEQRRIIQKHRKVGDSVIFLKMNLSINKITIFFRMGLPKFK